MPVARQVLGAVATALFLTMAIRSADGDWWLTVGWSFATVAMAIVTGLRFAKPQGEAPGTEGE